MRKSVQKRGLAQRSIQRFATVAIALLALAAIVAFNSGNNDKSAEATAPDSVKAVEPAIRMNADHTVSILPSVSSSGLTSEEISELRGGVQVFNQAVSRGDQVVSNQSSGGGIPLLGNLATTADAWNSQWVSCQWWGCTFALSHTTTQALIGAINGSSLWSVATNVTSLCSRTFPPAWWACPILGAEIAIGGRVFAWQLGNQDHGGGVIVFATYWHQWPGISPQ